MEKADSKDNLPPLASQDVVFKETAGDLCEGPSHVGSQAFRRLISHLATTTQRHTWLEGCYQENNSGFCNDCQKSQGMAGARLFLCVVQAISKPSCDTCSSHAVLPHQIWFVAKFESWIIILFINYISKQFTHSLSKTSKVTYRHLILESNPRKYVTNY